MASSGRGRVLVNGSLMTVRELQETMEPVLDIHGQSDARQRIVIAANGIDGDVCLVQPLHLTGQKSCRLHRRLVAIVKIAGNHQRIDLLLEAQIDDGDQRLSCRPADQLRSGPSPSRVGDEMVGTRPVEQVEVRSGGAWPENAPQPTPDDGVRRSDRRPWDESVRPTYASTGEPLPWTAHERAAEVGGLVRDVRDDRAGEAWADIQAVARKVLA